MGISERKERQRAELREQILDAAKAIIIGEGFTSLTMRKIADTIEYSPATIYLHFESRDAIAIALVRDGFAALLGRMADAMMHADPMTRLRALGNAYIAFGSSDPQTYRLMFMEDERWATEILARLDDDAAGDDAFDVLVTTVRELVSADIFQGDPQEVAGLLWAGLHGVVSLKLSCDVYPFSGPIAAPGAAMIEALIRGFTARALAP